MAATLMLACSNDKSGGHDGDEGVETEVNGTQLDGNTTLYGLVTDTSGNPVPGVVVSDGYGCVTTDANGVYQMERYKKARFVHYSTPAGYAVNTSADNYPLFYSEIVHKNIADRHDFVLTPLPAPESDFTLVCIADPQCATTAEISRYVNETIPDVETTVDGYKAKGTPVYGITLGDIVFDTPDLWSNMKESMANRNLPIFQTIGNHDHLQTETSDDNAAANFETQFGPRNYSFNRGDLRHDFEIGGLGRPRRQVPVIVMVEVLAPGRAHALAVIEHVVGIGPVVVGLDAGHVADLRAVLPERDFPVARGVGVPDVGHDALRIVHGRGVGRPAEGEAARLAEHLRGRIGPDLIAGFLVGRLVVLVGNGVARDLVDAVPVRRAVGADVRRPPCTAGGAVDMFEDRLPVTLVDVFLVVMRMADHDVRLGEPGQQVEHAVVVLVALVRHARTPAERDVRAEDHELVLVDVRQVLAQPLELLVGDAMPPLYFFLPS